MATVVGMAEFLEKVAKLKKRDEKIAALRANKSYQLLTVLQGAFDPRIQWLLPEGIPPFKANDLQDQESVFLRELRKLTYYVQGGAPVKSQAQREIMFIHLLENCAPADALLLCAMKDKKLPANMKGIDAQLVREAFPELLPPESMVK
jgi:Family of unknown function (DUF6433)